MEVLDFLHVIDGSQNGNINQIDELAAGVAGETGGDAAVLIGKGNGFQHVLGIAAAGYPDDQITGCKKVLQLLDKDVLIGQIVRVGQHCGYAVIEADHLKLKVPAKGTAFIHVANPVGRCRGASAIAHDENSPTVMTAVQHGIDQSVELVMRKSI